jgi:hypothetical protein
LPTIWPNDGSISEVTVMDLSAALVATLAKALDMESSRDKGFICNWPLSRICVKFKDSFTKLVSGSEIFGGLLAYNSWGASVTNCFWDIESSGLPNKGIYTLGLI